MWVSVRNTFLDTEAGLETFGWPSVLRGSRRAKSDSPVRSPSKPLSPLENATLDSLNGLLQRGSFAANSEEPAAAKSPGSKTQVSDSLRACSLEASEEFPALKKTLSSSSLSTACLEDLEDQNGREYDSCGEICGQPLDEARYRVAQEFEQQCGGTQDQNRTTSDTNLPSMEARPARINVSTETVQLEDWDGETFCQGCSASDRAKQVAQSRGLSLIEAQLRVMREFPLHFRSLSGRGDKPGELTKQQDEQVKFERTACISGKSTSVKDWDPEEFCAGQSAEDRAKSVAEACGLSVEVARLRVMSQFPTHFSRSLSLSLEATMPGEESRSPQAKVRVRRGQRKAQDLAQEFSRTHSEVPPTTMMVRNIPNRYTQQHLLEELEALGFAGSFDFLYAPIDFGSYGNVGYFFINFITTEWAMQFQRVVDGYPFKKFQQKTRTKVATVSVAHLQGLEANIHQYQNARVTGRARSKRCGPLLTATNSRAPLQK